MAQQTIPGELSAHALASEAIALELRLFDEAGPINTRERSFRLLNGRVPIALSAPHAVRQQRAGAERTRVPHRSEPYTGPLVIQLYRATGAWGLYATRPARTDPNSAPFSPYKRYGLGALARRAPLQLLIDLHGAHQARDFAVAIGTSPAARAGREQQIVDLLAARLDSALDGAVLVDPPAFRADGAGTVAAYCWTQLGIPAVQLEIGRAYRSPRQNPDAYARLFTALCDVVNELATWPTSCDDV